MTTVVSGGNARPPSVFLTPLSAESTGLFHTAYSQIGTPGTAVYPTANSAWYYPVHLGTSVIVNRFFWCNGTTAQTNNLQVGVYSNAGAAIVRGTSTTAAGVSAPQFDNVTDFALSPGRYYLAIWCNGTTTHLVKASPTVRYLRAMGVFQETALTGGLPSSATFAALTTGFMPLFGLALRATP